MVVSVVGLGSINTDGLGNAGGKVVRDSIKLNDDVVLHDIALHIGVLEANGVDHELLLGGKKRVPEKPGLRPSIIKGGALGAHKIAVGSTVRSSEESATHSLVGLLEGRSLQRVGAVRIGVQRNEHLASTVTVVVVDSNARLVDGQLLKVRATIAVELGVKVAEKTSLLQVSLGSKKIVAAPPT